MDNKDSKENQIAANPNKTPFVWKVNYTINNKLNYICVIAPYDWEAIEKFQNDYDFGGKWAKIPTDTMIVVGTELLGEFIQ